MIKSLAYVALAATLTVLVPSAEAARSEATSTARQGVIRCGGNHFLRLGGSEVHFTSYPVRNFDATGVIRIDRMRLFDGPGNVLFDSAIAGGLPQSESGIVGGASNILGPNQSVLFNTLDMPIAFQPDTNRPLQLEIEWSSPRSVLTLDAFTIRISRQRDPATGAILAERGRHAGECRSIALK